MTSTAPTGDGIVTHRFSLGSDFYEIDLCPQNLLSLRAALEPFVSAGRRVRGGNRRKPEPAPRPQGNSALDLPRQQRLAAAPHQQGNSALDFPREQRLAIRNWARDNGYDVADRVVPPVASRWSHQWVPCCCWQNLSSNGPFCLANDIQAAAGAEGVRSARACAAARGCAAIRLEPRR